MSAERDGSGGLDETVSAPGSLGRKEPSHPSAEAALGPGAKLGRYILGDQLGAGGMGLVFRARDPDLGREVAVKVLRADGAGPALERRLLREAQAMASASHDNLANVYDIGIEQGRVFVAMELVDGQTLRQVLADPARPWRDKLELVLAAGRGLAAAHAAGVIHRDFKPDNVLVGKTGRVKVVDFGLARADPDAVETADGGRALPADLSANLTQTGALLGTPAYMAPEQHAGAAVDGRADEFAFAVTAWEAVYGQRPFKSEAYSSLVAAVRAHAIEPPPKVAGVAPALEAALRRALAPEPEDRFPTMAELLAALTAALAPPRRRRRIELALAGGAVVAAGVAFVATGGSPTTSARPARAAGGDAPAGRPTPREIRGLDEEELSQLVQRQVGAALDEVGLHLDPIQLALETHDEDGAACLAEAGVTHAGTVELELRLARDGRVRSTAIVADDFRSTSVAGCLAARAMRWQFPPADQDATVRHAFELEPGRVEDVPPATGAGPEAPVPPSPPSPPGSAPSPPLPP